MNEQGDSSLVLVEFLDFLKGKNEKEMGDLYRSLKKIEAEKQNQKLCRTWSLTEYDTHLSTVLTEVNMKIFLEYSKCRHVYMALYPDDELAKWLEIEKPEIVLRTLKKTNVKTKVMKSLKKTVRCLTVESQMKFKFSSATLFEFWKKLSPPTKIPFG